MPILQKNKMYMKNKTKKNRDIYERDFELLNLTIVIFFLILGFILSYAGYHFVKDMIERNS